MRWRRKGEWENWLWRTQLNLGILVNNLKILENGYGKTRNIFGLSFWFLAGSSSNAQNFLSDEGFFCHSEGAPFELMLMKWLRVVPLNTLVWGWSLEDQVIRGLELTASPSDPSSTPTGSGGWRISYIKTLKTTRFDELPDWWMQPFDERVEHCSSIGTEASVLGTLLDITTLPCISLHLYPS